MTFGGSLASQVSSWICVTVYFLHFDLSTHGLVRKNESDFRVNISNGSR